MIKVKKLYTYPEITRTIVFEDGLNFILGEPNVSSNKTNGVGKSMSIEFLNYCLLRKIQGSRLLKIPKNIFPTNTQICLDLSINDRDITIIRTIQHPEKLVITTDGNKVEFDSLITAQNYFGDLFYMNNRHEINLNPSFRELINPSLREERSEFKDIVSYYDTSLRIPRDHLPALYMLSFDMATLRLAKSTIKDIDSIATIMSNLRKSLTQNGAKKLPDVRAEINSMESELEKLELEIEQFRSYESFELVEGELIDIGLSLNELKSKQSYARYSIGKIRSLPKAESIDEADVLFVYEQFKSGLGDQLKKSFDQVNEFKKKIEDFQNHIINEKLKELLAEHKDVNQRIRNLDERRAQILQLIDKKGVFKDLKQSLAVYHQRSEESSNLRTQLKSYDANNKEKNRLKSVKAKLRSKVDEDKEKNDPILISFNHTLSNIHEEIMGNRACSFDVETVDTDTYKDIVKFSMTIDYGGSHSVERIKVFIYDFSLMLNEFTSKRHPAFLVHDNIFDVDQDTLLKSLNFLYSLRDTKNFQYILTLNSDKADNPEFKEKLHYDIHDYSVIDLSKSERFIKGDKYSEMN